MISPAPENLMTAAVKSRSRTKSAQFTHHILCVVIAGTVALPTMAQTPKQTGSRQVLEEVMVSAQRRSESIVDVPISISAFDQTTLKNLNITSTAELQFATPGIVNTATAGDGISAVFIRGVGTGYSGPGLEGSVAVYMDDVYLQTQTSSSQATIDVEQIQVLKGPQGTLYGRNATGGAIIIETKEPVLEEMEGSLLFGAGNLDWRRTEAVFNAPLSSTLALRFAGLYEERDGYVRNVAISEKKSGVDAGTTYAGRLKALWQPADAVRSVLTLSHDRRNGNGAIHSLRYLPDGTPTGLGFYDTAQSPNREGGGGDDTESSFGSLRLDYTMGVWELTNTLAYRETQAYGCTDNDGVVAELLYFCTVSRRSPDAGSADGKIDKTLTNEFRVSSDSGGPLDLVAGLFYERNRARYVGRIGGDFFGTLTPTFDNRDELTAYSGYFDISYWLTEAVKLTGGLRYTKEEKEHAVRLDADAIDMLGGTAPMSAEADTNFDNVSPRVVLSYHAELATYYASYSQGFKSGGFNSPALTLEPPLRPEEIDAYEVGAKFRSTDGRMTLSGSLFYYDWQDVQVAFITGGGAGILQQNAAGAENYGGEANLNWAPVDAWRLSVGLAYTHARFTDFPQAAVYNLVGGTLTATAEDLEGRRVPHAPDLTATASATYLFALPGGWLGDLTAGVRYSSEYDFTAGAGGELRASRQDPLTLVNIGGRFTSPSQQYEIEWFVDNALDKEYIQLVSTGDTGVYMTPAAPRTYGARVRWLFR